MAKIAQLLGHTIGNYKLVDVLGEGGMGAVYKAEHILIGKKVALKLLHEEYAEKPEIVRRFFTEAKAVNKIGHRNIVDISDYGQTEDGRPYFIMELLEGTELAKEIERAGAIELKRAIHIIRQVASALDASHKAGIIHRDLKPENIFLLRDNDIDFVKVLDFGIAKLQEGADTTQGALSNKTKTGMIMGTPAYMAPEQAEGIGVDQRTDLYSLGIIFYEMLTGEQPFAADTFSRVLIKVLTEPVPPPRIKNPNIPQAIEAILLKMVEKEQANRFQNVGEFLATLKEAENNLGAVPSTLQAMQPPTTPRTPSPTTLSGVAAEQLRAQEPPAKRGNTAVIAAAAVVMLVGSGVFFTVGPGKSLLAGPAHTPAPVAAAALPAPAPASVPVEPAPPAPPAEEIVITFVSDPDGALVKEGDTILGQTPYMLTTKASDQPRSFFFSYNGYETQPLMKPLQKTEMLKITLEKTATAAKEPGKKPSEKKPTEKKPTEKKPGEETPGKETPGKIDSTTTLTPTFGKPR